jgi:hypothetical protein
MNDLGFKGDVYYISDPIAEDFGHIQFYLNFMPSE